MLNVQVFSLVDWSVVTDVSKHVAVIFSFEQSYSFFYNCHKSDRLPSEALDSLTLKMNFDVWLTVHRSITLLLLPT